MTRRRWLLAAIPIAAFSAVAGFRLGEAYVFLGRSDEIVWFDAAVRGGVAAIIAAVFAWRGLRRNA